MKITYALCTSVSLRDLPRYNAAMHIRDSFSLAPAEVDRIIQMAWEDRTPFEAIEFQFGLKEKDTIALMRQEMKPSSFRMWRKRMANRTTKHQAKRGFEIGRFRSDAQRNRF